MRTYYSAPVLVDISLTNRCNLKCEYCYASADCTQNKYDELSLEQYKILFHDLADMNIHRISLSGGEPFIREDFFDILEATQPYLFSKIINTNGTLITDDIAKKLTHYKFDRICVTIDGSTSEVHNSIRGNGSFNKAIEGIKRLQYYNLPVSTLFTLNEKNVDDLINTIKLNESLGIEYMSVMVVCPTGRASNGNILMSPDKWYPIFMQLTNMKARGDIKLNFKIVPPNESPVFWLFYYPLKYYNRLDLLSVWNQSIDVSKNDYQREVSCQGGIRACSINYNGDVAGCDLMMGIDAFKAGNVKQQSIKDIWNNSEVFNRLRNIDFKDLTGKCSECDNIWCGGGCRSAAYNLDGSILGSDLSCYYKQEV